jgi:tRNA splicing endonuclease
MAQPVEEALTGRFRLRLRSGLKFGADYLAYAGDPDTTHADFVVHKIRGAHVTGADVARMGRALFAFADAKAAAEDASFYTVRWAPV